MATKRQIGLRDFHVAPLVQDTTGTIEYGSPIKIPGIISATMSTERSSESYYSDDVAEDTFSSFSKLTLEVEVSNLSVEERNLLLGQTTKCGGVMSNKDDTAQEVGVMFRSKKTNGKFRYVALFKGKFVEPDESYASESDSLDAKTMTMTFTALPLANNGNYKLIVDEDGKDVEKIAGGADKYFKDFFKEMKYTLPAQA